MDATILDAVKDTEIDTEIEESGEIGELIHEFIVKFDTVLNLNSHTNHPAEKNSEHSSDAEKAVNKPKPSKTDLKKFHGEPTQWLTWRESFSSAVHSNNALSDIDKFTYLQTLLDGPAGSAIAGLPLTSENYANAIDILRTRYGNKQIIISHYMDILLKLPVAPSLNDLRNLRQIYDTIESNVRDLQSLGIHADSYGNLLIPVMFSKLPEELCLIISRKFDNDTWEIDLLLQALKADLEARERVGFLNPTVQQDKNQQGGARPRPPTAAALVTPWQERRTNSNNSPTCSFCRKNHQTAKCNNVRFYENMDVVIVA